MRAIWCRLCRCNKYGDAERIQREVLGARRRVLLVGEEHSETVTGAGNLAMSLWCQAKFAEAEHGESTCECDPRVCVCCGWRADGVSTRQYAIHCDSTQGPHSARTCSALSRPRARACRPNVQVAVTLCAGRTGSRRTSCTICPVPAPQLARHPAPGSRPQSIPTAPTEIGNMGPPPRHLGNRDSALASEPT